VRASVAAVAVGVLVACSLAGCSSPTEVGDLSWGDCGSDVPAPADATVSHACGELVVPRDWARPDDGRTFTLRLLRVRSSEQHDRIGSLLINPGGPGGSGIDIAAGVSSGQSFASEELLERFDVIGLDLRGTGRSEPITCITDAQLDRESALVADPIERVDVDARLALQKEIAADCAKTYGEDLKLFSTRQIARDLDALRAALGEAKLSYLGVSYGTYLGAVYAQLFPDNVRAMVLDGAIDPTVGYGTVAAQESQVRGYEHAFDEFAAWCERSDCPLSPDPRTQVTAILEQAGTSPAAATDGREATPSVVLSAIAGGLRAPQWQAMAEALDDVRDGDPSAVFQWADVIAERDTTGHYGPFYRAQRATLCADTGDRPSPERVLEIQREWRGRHPLSGGVLAMGLLACASWPAPADTAPATPPTGLPPTLVIGSRHDPATPYADTAKLAAFLGDGNVVTWEGQGHVALGRSLCVTEVANAYLTDLTLPEKGLVCAADE